MNNVDIFDFDKVNEAQLPALVTSQLNNLERLETSVKESVSKAVEARQKVSKANVRIGLFDYSKKEAIELLQNATSGLSEALISASDAQKLSFEYQSKLTDIMQYLFGLGVSNLAMNRTVVREIELKLKGASEEEISDLAKQELRNVILQLKAQEDMMEKQQFLTGKVREQAGQLKHHVEQIEELFLDDEKQNQQIANNTNAIGNHEKRLEQIRRADLKRDQLLTGHTKKLQEMGTDQEKQDVLIADNSKQLRLLATDLQNHQEKQAEDNAQLLVDIKELEKRLSGTIENLDNETAQTISLVKEELLIQMRELNSKVDKHNCSLTEEVSELRERINQLEATVTAGKWKIGITCLSVALLLIDILQLLGIL